MSMHKSIRLTLKIWRQKAPREKGRFETFTVDDADPNMSFPEMLDSLNERTNAFMAKMDVLKSGLSAIENQVVSIDRATHQWVENGHGNQRQGWEVLGAMEGMQSRTEIAFKTLGNTVQTILRSDELMREMEKRLSRFDV